MRDRISRRQAMLGGTSLLAAVIVGAATVADDGAVLGLNDGETVGDPQRVANDRLVIGGSDEQALAQASSDTILVISGFGNRYVVQQDTFTMSEITITTEPETFEDAQRAVDSYPTIAITGNGNVFTFTGGE